MTMTPQEFKEQQEHALRQQAIKDFREMMKQKETEHMEEMRRIKCVSGAQASQQNAMGFNYQVLEGNAAWGQAASNAQASQHNNLPDSLWKDIRGGQGGTQAVIVPGTISSVDWVAGEVPGEVIPVRRDRITPTEKFKVENEKAAITEFTRQIDAFVNAIRYAFAAILVFIAVTWLAGYADTSKMIVYFFGFATGAALVFSFFLFNRIADMALDTK